MSEKPKCKRDARRCAGAAAGTPGTTLVLHSVKRVLGFNAATVSQALVQSNTNCSYRTKRDAQNVCVIFVLLRFIISELF